MTIKRACAWCTRVVFNGVYVAVDEHLYARLCDRLSHGICAECRAKVVLS
jgi:hypothetical protein